MDTKQLTLAVIGADALPDFSLTLSAEQQVRLGIASNCPSLTDPAKPNPGCQTGVCLTLSAERQVRLGIASDFQVLLKIIKPFQ